jgi:sec-independent protein translocase protein TatA
MRPQTWQLVIILVIVLLLWGGPKLPGLAKSLAQSMRVFKKEIKSTDEVVEKPAEDQSDSSK